MHIHLHIYIQKTYIKYVRIQYFTNIAVGCTIMRKNGMQPYNNINILEDSNLDNDINESTFLMWKSELRKGLPSFWESMQGSNNNYNKDDIISKIETLS